MAEKKTSSTGIGVLVAAIVVAAVVLFALCRKPKQDPQLASLHEEIAASAYDDPDVDFDFYLQKYYRDLEFFGIIPTRPYQTTIRFANLDKITDIKHAHAVSYGYNRDDVIEIYINPSSWAKFTKPMRHWLLYHELTHDILNVDDLPLTDANYGRLMYPVLISYEHKTMDDFIEAFHEFVGEYNN